MKISVRGLRGLLFSLLLAAGIALALRFEPFSTSDSGFYLEAQISAASTAEMHVVSDFGGGFRRESTRDFWVIESAQPRRYRVPLPRGAIHRLFILPTDSATRFAVAGMGIMNPEGHPVPSVPMSVLVSPGSVIAVLSHPLSTIPPEDASWMETGIQFAGLAALFVLISRWAATRFPGWKERSRAWWEQRWNWSLAHPLGSLFAVAVLAVIVSCHPVIFFGKSFASPNNGALCLYDSFPTIPGVGYSPVETWNSSDVQALPQSHLPYSVVESRSIFRDHEFPLWLRENMCGLTLLGQGQSMIGDPLHWIPILANGAAWAWDVKFLAAKLLFAFGIGLLSWIAARHLPTAMLLAFSSAFIGFFSFRFIHPAFFSVSYAPWILLCWLGAGRARTFRGAAVCAFGMIAANWMELNSGAAKESCMLMAALNATGGLTLLALDEPWPRRIRKLAIMGAGSLVFLLVSAPFWMVFLSSLQESFTSYDHPAAYQIEPSLILGLFDDLFYRELMPAEWHVAPSVNFLVLIGVLWALADGKRLCKDRVFLAALLAALPLIALVFGIAPPQWLIKLPLMKNIWHVDNTFSCPLFILLFVLAAFGLRNCAWKMKALAEWKADWQRTLIYLAILAGIYFGSVNARSHWPSYGLQASRTFEPSPFFIGYCAALFLAAALLPVVARRLRLGIGSGVMLGTVAAAALFAVHFRHGMWLETKFDYYVMNPRQRMDLQAHSAAVDYILSRQREPGRTGSFGQVLRPGFNALYGLETATGSDPVGDRWYGEWLDAAGFSKSWAWTNEIEKGKQMPARCFYDAMNVRFFLGSNASNDPESASLKKALKADLEVYESPTAWPRAFFTDRVSLYQKPEELAALIEHGDGRPLAGVQDASPALGALGADQLSRRIVPAEEYRLTTNATSFQLTAPAPGLAVLTEAFATGSFRVSLNGVPATCLRVNHAFKGVLLPAAGRYRITFSYWPRLLTPALWISCAGWIALIFAGVMVLRAGVRPL